jgi:4-hydroxythreonine-4-phosphate dehydrogenase
MADVLPRIAITVGDPAGIGPEIAESAAADPLVTAACVPLLYGPSSRDAAARYPVGRVSAEAGRNAYDTIVRAVADAREGLVDGVATAPISKEAFALAGLPWPGHTELLGHLCGTPRVAMMFHAEALRVVLATVHVALRDVPSLLTRERLLDVLDLTVAALPEFGWPRPRLAICGLNPHAGEHGLMGREDEDVIVPVVAAARARGVDVRGPIPADTVFVRATRGEFDAVIACYHDQGLIPVKLLAFGSAVNVTIGLPIIRTSVDHGTAFDIAGKGVADAGSMVAAVLLAARLAERRREGRAVHA